MTATIDINQVSHQFGDFIALSDITLTIPAGSYAVLLGPSGCGKTTLLSILGGFLVPGNGTVSLNGMDVTNVPPAKRTTTTMFQDYALFPHMTLLDNVSFGLRMRGLNKVTRYSKAQELLELVGLESSATQKPHQLSGGQRQRVALARALAVEPDVLLLDEPLGALDLKLRRQMQDELKNIQERIGTTFIHVTHDQEEAMAIADQIIVMNAGKVEDTGMPESIYLRPRTLFTASFMGEANQLDATVDARDSSSISVSTALGKFQLPHDADTNHNAQVGDDIRLCFRPEHLCSYPSTAPAPNKLELGEACVVDIAFFGTHHRCRLQTGTGFKYTAHLPQDEIVEKGQSLAISLDPNKVTILKLE